MRICIVTDAWEPQINGVVTTLQKTVDCLQQWGHDVHIISPEKYRTIPCSAYKEIRLPVLPGRDIKRRLDKLAPDTIHIATEGPLGQAARRHCLNQHWQFST